MTPKCDGWCDARNPVTHIGSKGYAYCATCADRRRKSGRERCRVMSPAELNRIKEGKPIKRY